MKKTNFRKQVMSGLMVTALLGGTAVTAATTYKTLKNDISVDAEAAKEKSDVKEDVKDVETTKKELKETKEDDFLVKDTITFTIADVKFLKENYSVTKEMKRLDYPDGSYLKIYASYDKKDGLIKVFKMAYDKDGSPMMKEMQQFAVFSPDKDAEGIGEETPVDINEKGVYKSQITVNYTTSGEETGGEGEETGGEGEETGGEGEETGGEGEETEKSVYTVSTSLGFTGTEVNLLLKENKKEGFIGEKAYFKKGEELQTDYLAISYALNKVTTKSEDETGPVYQVVLFAGVYDEDGTQQGYLKTLTEFTTDEDFNKTVKETIDLDGNKYEVSVDVEYLAKKIEEEEEPNEEGVFKATKKISTKEIAAVLNKQENNFDQTFKFGKDDAEALNITKTNVVLQDKNIDASMYATGSIDFQGVLNGDLATKQEGKITLDNSSEEPIKITPNQLKENDKYVVDLQYEVTKLQMKQDIEIPLSAFYYINDGYSETVMYKTNPLNKDLMLKTEMGEQLIVNPYAAFNVEVTVPDQSTLEYENNEVTKATFEVKCYNTGMLTEHNTNDIYADAKTITVDFDASKAEPVNVTGTSNSYDYNVNLVFGEVPTEPEEPEEPGDGNNNNNNNNNNNGNNNNGNNGTDTNTGGTNTNNGATPLTQGGGTTTNNGSTNTPTTRAAAQKSINDYPQLNEGKNKQLVITLTGVLMVTAAGVTIYLKRKKAAE